VHILVKPVKAKTLLSFDNRVFAFLVIPLGFEPRTTTLKV
jgi:hypothetical protein